MRPLPLSLSVTHTHSFNDRLVLSGLHNRKKESAITCTGKCLVVVVLLFLSKSIMATCHLKAFRQPKYPNDWMDYKHRNGYDVIPHVDYI